MPAARRGPAVGPRAPPQPDLLHPWRAQRGDPRPPRWAQRPADEEARRQPACPLRATRPPRPTTPAGRPLTSWPAGSGAASTSTYHVLVERHAYSVPFQLLREQVEVRYTTATVEVFFKGRRVTSPPAPLRRAAVHRRRAHAERPPRPRRVDAVAPPPLGREGRSRDRPARGPHPAEPPAPPSRGTGPCSASCAWGGSTATTGSTRRAPAPSPSAPLPLRHRPEHPRRRPGPAALRAAGRNEPTPAHDNIRGADGAVRGRPPGPASSASSRSAPTGSTSGCINTRGLRPTRYGYSDVEGLSRPSMTKPCSTSRYTAMLITAALDCPSLRAIASTFSSSSGMIVNVI